MSNAVFEVSLADGERVVARVAPAGTKRYEMERALMKRVRLAGVPCPAVHAVSTVDDFDVMLVEYVHGVRLSDAPGALAMAAECGEVLALIHGVPVEGYGHLDAGGAGVSHSLEQWFVDDFESRFQAASDVVDPDARSLIARIWSLFDAARPFLRGLSGSLAHGDFSPANVLVANGRVTGVVDWESAKAGPPGFDFGWWDWCTDALGTPFSTEDLIEGYVRHRPLDLNALAEMRRLVVLRILVGHVAWAAEREDKSYLGPSLVRLRSVSL